MLSSMYARIFSRLIIPLLLCEPMTWTGLKIPQHKNTKKFSMAGRDVVLNDPRDKQNIVAISSEARCIIPCS